MATIGGQAVLEGVMMRGPSSWAVAVRRPDGRISEISHEVSSVASTRRWLRLPVIRGVVALGDGTTDYVNLTGGQGSYSHVPSHYEIVPSNEQAKIIAAAKKEEEEH